MTHQAPKRLRKSKLQPEYRSTDPCLQPAPCVQPPLQHSTARRNFDRCDTSAIEYDEPITVFSTQLSRILRQCRDHVFHELILVGEVRVVVRDVHAVAADEPDA